MQLILEVAQEEEAGWLAEITSVPGVQAYGQTGAEAIERVKALALRVLADRLEHGEPIPQMDDLFAVVP
jgi:predicted RNase H-like HicB family nuclease